MNNPPVMTIRLAGEIHARLGDRAAAAAMAQELETRRAAGAAVPASYIAFLHAAMDNPNEAFRWLEQAWTDGDPLLTMLGVYPSCDRLRGDPRYRSLMGRLGL